jgi:excisionase family DNA binding protein
MRDMETTKLLLNRKEAANALSLGIRTVDQLIRTGRLPAKRIGRRVLVPAQSIRNFALLIEGECEGPDLLVQPGLVSRIVGASSSKENVQRS